MNKFLVHQSGKPQAVPFDPGQTIMSALLSQGIKIQTPCAGNGTCGKCAVDTPHGVKLACQALATDGMDIYIKNPNEAAMAINVTYETTRSFAYDRDGRYGIAIDIGTTTLAFELIDMATGRHMFTVSAANSQRGLGADVITRIKQATQGGQTRLHGHIVEDILQGITHILKKAGLPASEVDCVSVAGNTTMLHLLQNLPCDSLGVFPFTPVDIAIRHCKFADVFGDGFLNAQLIILPGISTFVGADITGGILCCQSPKDATPNLTGVCTCPRKPLGQTQAAFLLIDLGTNGEMALFTHDRVLVTSTAAGPAFEGGNISKGTASVPGAISKVRYSPENNVFVYETIENQPPIGICGTGVLDIAAELVRHNLADETGRLDDPRVEDGAKIAGGIIFTQKDMREIQLAKSAVRSGIEILLDVGGYSYNDIGRVYLAGGFGHKINMDSAVALGLIPPALVGKVLAVGNTSLGGAAHVLLSRAAEKDAVALVARAEEINLSTHPRFNDLFMEHMMFGWPV